MAENPRAGYPQPAVLALHRSAPRNPEASLLGRGQSHSAPRRRRAPCEAPASIVQEGKPPAPDRTCKAAEAITTRAAGLRSRALGGPPGWSAQAARLPGAQSRNSNWARYRKEISDNIKNSRLAVVLGFGPAPRWARPIHFQKPARTPEPAALFLSWASSFPLCVGITTHNAAENRLTLSLLPNCDPSPMAGPF